MNAEDLPSSPNDAKFDWKAVGAVTVGNMFEAYDFIVFSFFAIDIGRTFFPAKDPTTSLLSSLAVFWSGFIIRPVGGAVIGALADRTGRKGAMVLTIALMAAGTLLLAATPSVATIGVAAPILVILARLMQGFAFGGEIGPSTAYLLESAPSHRRAFFASFQIASQSLAVVFAGIVSLSLSFIVSKGSSADWGWRVPFYVGLIVVPIAVIIRSRLPEPLGETSGAGRSTVSLLGLLVAEHGKTLVLLILIIMSGTIATYIGLNMPTYSQSALKLGKAASEGVTLTLGLASLGFTLVGGWLADRYGRRPTMVIPRVALALAAIPMFWVAVYQPSLTTIYGLVILLAALTSISSAAAIAAIPEALPRDIRSTGLSVAYALSVSLFGGSAPWFVTKLIALTGDKVAPGFYLAATSLIGAVAAHLLPETKGRSL